MGLLASALTDWLTVGIAFVATVGALYQLRQINKQTRLEANASKSESYGQVTQQMSTLRDLFLAHPDWLDFFYDGKDPDDVYGSPLPVLRKRELELVCEAIADFADGLVEQRRTVPEADMDWSTWDAYLRFMYQQSPILRRYLRENTDFYPDYLLATFGHLVVRHELSGAVESEWAVGEWGRPEDGGGAQPDALETWIDATFVPGAVLHDPRVGRRAVLCEPRVGRPGFPWMRTWLITQYPEETTGGDTEVPERRAGWADLGRSLRETLDSRLVDALVSILPAGAPETEPPQGDEPERPMLVAYAHPHEETEAQVLLAWRNAPDPAAPTDQRELEELLCSWVVEQVEASSRLRRVRVYFHDGEGWADWGRFALASATRTRRIPRPISARLRRRGVLRKQATDPWRERFLVRQFDVNRPADARWRRALRAVTPERRRRSRRE